MIDPALQARMRRRIRQRRGTGVPSTAVRRARVPREPRAAWQLYVRNVNRMITQVEELALDLLVQEERQDAQLPEEILSQLSAIELRLFETITPSDLGPLMDAIGRSVAAHNGTELQRVLGINIRSILPGETIDAFRQENVSRITSMMGESLVRLTKELEQAEREGIRVEELAKRIRHRFDVTRSRAKLIARDQVLSLNAQITKTRQQAVGVEEYIWTTSKDSRVRPEHRAREGKRFRWDTPPPDGHPGEAIQCRCTPYPILPELEEPREVDTEEPFETNEAAPKVAEAGGASNLVDPSGLRPKSLRDAKKAFEGLDQSRVQQVALGKERVAQLHIDLANVAAKRAEKIRKKFQFLQPIKIEIQNGRVLLVDGRHRVLAAKEAGASHIQAIVTIERNGVVINQYTGPVPL